MMEQGQTNLEAAAIAVLIAAAVNTLVKPVLMTFIAGLRAASFVWIPLLVALAGGGAVAWLWR
jgi:uncharacterized membrane protein (DUF4010 family)